MRPLCMPPSLEPPQYMSARGSLFFFAWNVAGYKNSSAENHAHASRASKISWRDAGQLQRNAASSREK